MILKVIIAWTILMIFVLVKIIFTRNRITNNGKDDFVDWYQKNKAEILKEVERKGIKAGFSLEAAIDEEYELYLLH